MNFAEKLLQELEKFLIDYEKYKILLVLTTNYDETKEKSVVTNFRDKFQSSEFFKHEIFKIIRNTLVNFASQYKDDKDYLLSTGYSQYIILSQNQLFPKRAIVYVPLENSFLIILSFASYNEEVKDNEIFYLTYYIQKAKTELNTNLYH